MADVIDFPKRLGPIAMLRKMLWDGNGGRPSFSQMAP